MSGSTLVGVPHERAGPLGSHLRDFATLLQVLGEVPEMGKSRADLGGAIRNNKTLPRGGRDLEKV